MHNLSNKKGRRKWTRRLLIAFVFDSVQPTIHWVDGTLLVTLPRNMPVSNVNVAAGGSLHFEPLFGNHYLQLLDDIYIDKSRIWGHQIETTIAQIYSISP